MMRFRLTIKQDYHSTTYTFTDWNDVCNFAGDAVIHGVAGTQAIIELEEEDVEE